ncbi:MULTISPECIES: dTDP-4-dehydrorhamnose reductase [Novosphingobium]|uniref:dTDP-4-dehydrorhamnose reductase n=1 Tax=Novosphingobium TaxID=165696 RepID=UPI0007886F6B|nr:MULTISPECIES: dTDP-4-dehydrorhamnose reductase [Novosphingobium]PTR10407.1 dTDP-4-dehydrorhamnose reductase [Novosphingobium sp. GV055]PUB03078.1 dTDP-4-dehydrorhamnose reductase [Novosphingobium sp. GV061]PUB19739.1 dTDP-4-dehydrorhamnose reductase [Novosphingobium sp. GV079]PUB41378.1 dTDP-4-dehydrorhamnose reductase [Novosphingobium sp. GV027]WQD94155.1 dTDP-4-dehydrorhamnose reductase [Novosphingobium capsulatum]
MRIAVTGRTGQVVSSLMERGPAAGHTIVAVGRPEMDLADPDSIVRALEAAAPDLVVSAAAYTAVDKAEHEPGLATAVNVLGAEAVATAAARLGVPIIHLSTDYVFDGRGKLPYVETDMIGPTTVYGMSKLLGERAVLAAHPGQAVVLRVAWVYSPFGKNFLRTMLGLATTREEIAVVDDQFGNPTSALDIADGILTVAANIVARRDSALRGVFHMTAQGHANWAEFATRILAEASARGWPTARVRPIASAAYPTPAARPANSRLDSGLIARVHGIALPAWEDALTAVMDRLPADGMGAARLRTGERCQ